MGDPAIDPSVAFIANEEGFRAEPYGDIAGNWTIGYGQTYMEDNSKVRADTPPITREQALWWVRKRVADTYLPAVRRSTVHVPLSLNQVVALVSLCYNIGPANFRESTLVQQINAGALSSAADQFPLWNKARDPATHELRVSRGLTARRMRERALFLNTSAERVSEPAKSLTSDDLNAAELRRVKGA